MNPAQKIAAIKVVASKLAGLGDWAEIDLTLRTFGFPTYDNWGGGGSDPQDNMYRYCMDMLERGDDTFLVSIKEYVEGDKSEQTDELDIRDVTGPWIPQRFKLFMSHISKDKIFISEVKVELAKYGIDGFVAHEDIKPTKEWMDEIVTALDTCDALSAFITPEYHSSKWTDQEVGYCIRRRVLILPIGLGQTPYGFMGKYQGAQCKGKDANEVAELIFNTLLSNPKTKTRMFESLVGSFEESNSFDEAARRSRLLDKIDTWSPELLRRVQAAKENNSQISDSFVAAPKVDLILRTNTF